MDDVAGTTRDPVDELIELGGSIWNLSARQEFGAVQTNRVGPIITRRYGRKLPLNEAEVAVVVLDASVPISEQDLRIITVMVEEVGKALIIVMNKWDLVDEDRQISLDREIDRHLDQSGMGTTGQPCG